VLDLRLICNEASDYANDIEPSVTGGEKTTDAILKVVGNQRSYERRQASSAA